jgi:hypothetical protein
MFYRVGLAADASVNIITMCKTPGPSYNALDNANCSEEKELRHIMFVEPTENTQKRSARSSKNIVHKVRPEF